MDSRKDLYLNVASCQPCQVYYETLACGTGATACASVAYLTNRVRTNKIKVIARGGEMTIEITKNKLFMIGPAYKVFKGEICVHMV